MSNAKEISIKIKVRPFTVPNFILTIPSQPTSRSEESPSIPLSEIDAMTLHEMCEEFTNAVFDKAGKQRPPQSA